MEPGILLVCLRQTNDAALMATLVGSQLSGY
jgi:hypothetical protein